MHMWIFYRVEPDVILFLNVLLVQIGDMNVWKGKKLQPAVYLTSSHVEGNWTLFHFCDSLLSCFYILHCIFTQLLCSLCF